MPLSHSIQYNVTRINNEEWKPIPEFESYYLISNYGRIQSMVDGPFSSSGRIRRPEVDKRTGNIRVYLFKDGKKYARYVHTLVAQCFMNPPLEKHIIEHKDRNKYNCSVSNLYFVLYSDLMKNKKIKHKKGENSSNSKFTDKDIQKIREMYSYGVLKSEIREHFDISYGYLNKILDNSIRG